MMMQVPSVDVNAFAEEISSKPLFLLDVREESEEAIARLPNAVLIPLAQIPQRLDEIPTDMPVVVFCHMGGRSARAVAYLLGNGFDDVRNLTGGIDAWSRIIDPEVMRY